jgi:hypothetical protein
MWHVSQTEHIYYNRKSDENLAKDLWGAYLLNLNLAVDWGIDYG